MTIHHLRDILHLYLQSANIHIILELYIDTRNNNTFFYGYFVCESDVKYRKCVFARRGIQVPNTPRSRSQ